MKSKIVLELVFNEEEPPTEVKSSMMRLALRAGEVSRNGCEAVIVSCLMPDHCEAWTGEESLLEAIVPGYGAGKGTAG